VETTKGTKQLRVDEDVHARAKSKAAAMKRSLKSVADQLLTDFADGKSMLTAEQCAETVEAMCHWRQLQTPLGPELVAGHRAFHFGYTCPYEAMAAVLRGLPDPRTADYQVETP
jgi:hypothetical protein